jgi:hypothetical protein
MLPLLLYESAKRILYDPMTPCDHLKAGSWPLQIEHTFTSLITFADALVSCRHCARQYLLELFDVRGSDRLYRISEADPALATGLLHNLNRGSCDLSRADAEFAHFANQCDPLETILWVDSKGPTVTGQIAIRSPLPPASWQALPCDGAWFELLGLRS